MSFRIPQDLNSVMRVDACSFKEFSDTPLGSLLLRDCTRESPPRALHRIQASQKRRFSERIRSTARA